MIPLVRHVTSFELGKQLKELGIKQDSMYYWVDVNDDAKPEGVLFQFDELESIEDCYSAFTVAELGELLPYDIHSYKSVRVDKWCCTDNHGMLMLRETEAEARAKMLIYLIENKFMGVNK